MAVRFNSAMKVIKAGRIARLRATIELLLATVFKDAPNRAKAIFPADFLAFATRASVIRYRYFADSHTFAIEAKCGNLRRDFRLETKSVFFDFDRLNDFAPEHFVARFHISQVQVRAFVREPRQHLITECVEREGLAAHVAKAGAVDDVGHVIDERLQELVKIIRVVFEICVLDDYKPAPSSGEPCPQCSAFALVVIVEQDTQPIMRLSELIEAIARAIGREVIDNNDFEIEFSSPHCRQNAANGLDFVEYRDHDRQ